MEDMPGYDPSLPGELNRFASLDADLCVEFNLTGRFEQGRSVIVDVPTSKWVGAVRFVIWCTVIRNVSPCSIAMVE